MGYTTSTVHGIEVPDSSETNNIPEDIGKVVTALEGGSIVRRLTGAAIAALTAPQKPAGLVVYNTTTGKLQISDGTNFANLDAAAVAAQSTADAALPKSGGTMSGAIAMGSNKVTGLAAASTNGDAVRYEQAVMKAGDTMSGTLIVDNSSGYSNVILKNADAAFWIGTDPGASNALTIAVLNKTTLAYVATAMSVNPTTGEVTFPNGIRVPIAGIDYY